MFKSKIGGVVIGYGPTVHTFGIILYSMILHSQ